MTNHKDTFRSKVPTKEYKAGHDSIFGKAKGRAGMDDDRSFEINRESRKAKVAAGKMDAQYYLDNEVRVSQNPDYQAKPKVTKEFKDNFNKIFGKGPDR